MLERALVLTQIQNMSKIAIDSLRLLRVAITINFFQAQTAHMAKEYIEFSPHFELPWLPMNHQYQRTKSHMKSLYLNPRETQWVWWALDCWELEHRESCKEDNKMMMREKSKRETSQPAGPSMPPSMAYAPLKPLFASNLATAREFPFNLFHQR